MSKQQDFCLFIDSLKSLTYIGLSKYQNHQYKDIGNQLSTTGDPKAQVIPRLRVSLVYMCSLLTRINKTNGFSGPFDGHCGCQLHIFERSICLKRSSRTRSQTTRQGQETTWGWGVGGWIGLEPISRYNGQKNTLDKSPVYCRTKDKQPHTLTLFTISVLQIPFKLEYLS